MNEPATGQQLWQMLQMGICGWIMMLTVQEKEMLLKLGRFSYRSRMAGDFLFCMMWSVGLWMVLLQISGGLLRNYIFIGLAGGILLYCALFRRRMKGFCRVSANVILCVCRRIRQLIFLPWRVIYGAIGKPCAFFVRKIVKEKQEFAMAEENIIEKENIF